MVNVVCNSHSEPDQRDFTPSQPKAKSLSLVGPYIKYWCIFSYAILHMDNSMSNQQANEFMTQISMKLNRLIPIVKL